MKAAHFLLLSELACSPPNEAIISALISLGLDVDLFTPGRVDVEHLYGSRVQLKKVSYDLRWVFRNAWRARWRDYHCFSGTSEDPIGVVGVLASLHRRASFVLADEIKSGLYRGDSPEYWKKLCRWGMRDSQLQIVNDAARVQLQRDYCQSDGQQPIIIYPGCFRNPPHMADRARCQEKWGFPPDSLVIGLSGGFNLMTGADWLISALEAHQTLCAVLQPLGIDPVAKYLLKHLDISTRLFVEQERLGWESAWAQAGCLDIGICVYLHPGPQFRNMGISSNRLCMFLAMGVPVIASRQPSFQFIEDYECGVLVDDEKGFIDAIDRISGRLDEMKANALRCAREYIDAPGKYVELRNAIARVVGVTVRSDQP